MPAERGTSVSKLLGIAHFVAWDAELLAMHVSRKNSSTSREVI